MCAIFINAISYERAASVFKGIILYGHSQWIRYENIEYGFSNFGV
jgi:hypothetical protein